MKFKHLEKLYFHFIIAWLSVVILRLDGYVPNCYLRKNTEETPTLPTLQPGKREAHRTSSETYAWWKAPNQSGHPSTPAHNANAREDMHSKAEAIKQTETPTSQTPQMTSDYKVLTNFGKTTPKLDETNLKQWQHLITNSILNCNKLAAELILKARNPQIFEVTTTTSSSSSSSSEIKAKDWKNEKPEEYGRVMGHIYTQLLMTIDMDEVPESYSIFSPQAAELYEAIMNKYDLQTRISRFSEVKAFFNLELRDDKSFGTFVSDIKSKSAKINNMAPGKPPLISDELKLVVLIEGTQTQPHLTTAIQTIEMEPNINFEQAVKMLEPASNRFDAEKKTQEKANLATRTGRTNGRTTEEKGNCWNYNKYGGCPEGAKCTFKHNIEMKGTMKCPICGVTGHSPKFCKLKGTAEDKTKFKSQEKARKAQESEAEINKRAEIIASKKVAEMRKLDKEAAMKAKMVTLVEETYPSSDDEPTTTSHKASLAKETMKEADLGQGPGHAFWGMTNRKEQKKLKGGQKPGELKNENDAPKLEAKAEPARARVGATMLAAGNSFGALGASMMFTNRAVTTACAGAGAIMMFFTVLMMITGSLPVVNSQPIQIIDSDATLAYRQMETAGWGYSTQIGNIHTAKFVNSTTPGGNRYMHTQWLKWTVDSGCSTHICMNRDAFKQNTLRRQLTSIEIADGAFMSSAMIGQVTLKLTNRAGTKHKIVLDDVLYVPSASSNLLSVSKLIKTNHKVVFDNDMCRIKQKSTGSVIEVPMKRNMFDIDLRHNKTHTCKAAGGKSGSTSKTQLWHQRLAHPSEKYLRHAVPARKLDKNKLCPCEACIKGGMKKQPFQKRQLKPVQREKRQKFQAPQTQQRLDKVMADTCSPYPQHNSMQGSKVFFVLLDIHTRKCWILFAKSKAEFPEHYNRWLRKIQTQIGRTPILFMPDGGTEFTNNKLQKILEDNGTEFMTTCAGNPNQNPHVERMNGVIQEKVRKVLEHAGLPPKFWQDAARFVVEVQNAMPHSALDMESPNNRWDPLKQDKTIALKI